MPTRSPASLPMDAPERRRLPILLRRAWYGMNQAFRRRIAHLGVTPDQFTVMRTVREAGSGGLAQSHLVKSMGSDPNTIASLLERMEKAGLIERRAHETDRRAYRIRLKPAGERKYQQAREESLRLQAEVLSPLSEPDREAFLIKLSQVAEACRVAVEKSPRKTRRAA